MLTTDFLVKFVKGLDTATAHLYVTYHQMPDDLWARLDYVFDLLINAFIQYKGIHQQILVIFIDGCDALAKSNTKIFDRLVYLAKVLINDKSIVHCFRMQ